MPNLNKILNTTTPEAIASTPIKHARTLWARFRADNGFKETATKLLSAPDYNTKLTKTGAYGLALAPHRVSGMNVCPASTPECRRNCVSLAGNGFYPVVQRARITKTKFLAAHPEAFMALLIDEISKIDSIPVRLNVFSDIAWEQHFPWMFDLLSDTTFYDYTKRWDRIWTRPDNYTLAASVSEKTTDNQIDTARIAGFSLAVVFAVKRTKSLPTEWRGMPVVDADKSDRWMIEHTGPVVGGLRMKGKLQNANSPFARSVT